jgi:hypothetical protein
MTNQPSLSQLLIPIIPPDACPTGTTVDILNFNNQQYLGQATIDIPGLVDFNPATIIQIQEEQQAQQDEIDALNPLVKTANVALSTGDQNIPIVFSSAKPDLNYYMVVEINDTAGGTSTDGFGWSVIAGTKSTTGISLRFIGIQASQDSFNYFAVSYPTF